MAVRTRGRSSGAGARAKTARPTPETLLERVAGRDQAALSDLYARFAPGLLGLAMQMAISRHDAAEAVEDAFVRLWREAPRIPRETASVAPWLVWVVRHRALQKRRKEKSVAGQPRDSYRFLAESYSWLPTPGDLLQFDAKRELLRKTLRQLPQHQQAALGLAVWEGLTEEEIAERAGEPLAKVQSSLRAGMRFIRHRMRVVLGKWSAHI